MNKRLTFIITGLVSIALVLVLIICKKNFVCGYDKEADKAVKKSFMPERPAEVGNLSGPAGALYKEADKLMSEGKYAEARNAYKSILSEHPDSNLAEASRMRLEGLNTKILFSPIPTEDSIFYEVKAGDNLIKIAKNFGTTVELIMKSNALEDTVIMPGAKLKISKAKYSILVDKSQNTLILKSDGDVFKTYTVATGKSNSTPIGTYQISEKLTDPTWYKAGAVVPPESPDNILGTRWMGLTLEHYGIHGTTDDFTLGQQVTAGCVRMSNKDVEELYSIVPIGTEVTIID